MKAPAIEIDLSRSQPFEACAALVSVLAHPEASDDARARLMASLCHLVLKGAFLGGEAAEQAKERPIKPIYAFRSDDDDDMRKDLKKIRRLLRDRMVAAQMALPLIMRAEGTLPAKLPEGLSKLSLNELGPWAMSKVPKADEDDVKSESGNIESRIWRPSLPAIHLAAALAVVMQRTSKEGYGEIEIGQLLTQFWIAEQVAELGERYGVLIEKGSVLPGKPPGLIRFRLVSG